MTKKPEISKGNPYPMGVTAVPGGINVAVAFDHVPNTGGGILLYDRRKKETRIPFPQDCRTGNLYAAFLKIDITAFHSYRFYCDDKVFMDPYATAVDGRDVWGKMREGSRDLTALLPEPNEFDWGKDHFPETDYKDTIIYGLHVRGFTKSATSGVSRERRGTFEGVEDKIDYLKELGISAVEFMPVYEFDEIILNPAYRATDLKESMIPEGASDGKSANWQYKINYWGFADRGSYYFAPKASYSAYHDPVRSFKHLVRTLHSAGIEVILQFYFPLKYDPCYIQRVVHYWVTEYHVDGFHLVGMKIPRALLALDPMLARTKLIMEEPGGDSVYAGRRQSPGFRNLASYKDGFRADARKFLKGDEDMLRPMAEHMRRNGENEAVINHVADYRGFTLMDVVSFDQKHNGPNGENNRDGSEYNYSWNCGIEGSSRKKGILSMRLSQRKNILSFLFMSQAVPFIQAGDEFGHSANGNNNPYCQDNDINWLSWRFDQSGKKLLEFTKSLIAFRKSHPILHRRHPMRIMDTISCGYPDLSYHGQNAWYAQMENYNRHMGIMMCGLYENLPDGKTDDFIYVAMNMHWITHDFALPGLPAGYEWKMVCDTRDAGSDENVGGFYSEGVELSKIVADSMNARKGGERKIVDKDNDAPPQGAETREQPKSISLKPRSVMLLIGSASGHEDVKSRKQKSLQ